MDVEALNNVGAKVGDLVVIGFKGSALLKLSFLLYVFPIICMLIGAIIGQKIALAHSYKESLLSPAFGFAFFIVAFFIIRARGKQLAQKQEYRPKIIRILRQS